MNDGQYNEWKEWFIRTFRPNTNGYRERLGLLQHEANSEDVLNTLFDCEWDTDVLQCVQDVLTFGHRSLAPAYRKAQRTPVEPNGKFAYSNFTNEPYTAFVEVLQDALDKMKRYQLSGEVTKMHDFDRPANDIEDDAAPDDGGNPAPTSKRPKVASTSTITSQPHTVASTPLPNTSTSGSKRKGKGKAPRRR